MGRGGPLIGAFMAQLMTGRSYWVPQGQMAANILKAMDCWMMHLKLDAKTGLDPPSGAKVRSCEGFDVCCLKLPRGLGGVVFAEGPRSTLSGKRT
jgi:hypothetical protein